MTKNEFDNFIKNEKKELFENEFLKLPSVSILEGTAEKLLNLIENLRKENNTTNAEFLSLKMDLDVFKADLPGELNHDYRNKNKRYKEKWIKEKRKLNEYISQFRAKLPD